jgi:hypothetical protein
LRLNGLLAVEPVSAMMSEWPSATTASPPVIRAMILISVFNRSKYQRVRGVRLSNNFIQLRKS